MAINSRSKCIKREVIMEKKFSLALNILGRGYTEIELSDCAVDNYSASLTIIDYHNYEDKKEFYLSKENLTKLAEILADTK